MSDQIIKNNILKVSIGMPVYNGEKYIKQALDSLLAQTFVDFELIISDNASTDNTEAICQTYLLKDKRIKYYRQVENLGASKNFQVVLRKANGSYFMWAASDDLWDINWLDNLYQNILLTRRNMVFGRINHINQQGLVIYHPANNNYYEYKGSPFYRRLKFFLQLESMGKANVICCLYTIAMRDEMDLMLDEYLAGKCTYDFIFIYNSLKYGDLSATKQSYMYKRLHGDSEGGSSNQINKCNGFFSKITLKIFWPFPNKLINDYLNYSSVIEKLFLIILLPVKVIVHNFARIKIFFDRLLKKITGKD